MKRKEMIKKLENKFEDIFAREETDGDLYIYCESIDKQKIFICSVSEYHQYNFTIEREYYLLLSENEQKELFDIIVEYSATPIKEREEVPQYQYFFSEVSGINLCEYDMVNRCLNYDKRYSQWCWSDNENNEDFKTIFTHQELKDLGVNVEDLRKKYIEVRVK